MLIRIGLEVDPAQHRTQAWALDFPGAFAYGRDESEAMLNLPRALLRYQHWVNQHAGEQRLNIEDFDLRLVETWKVYSINDQYEPAADGYEVNAWFRDDWRPLSPEEVAFGQELLTWSRSDLLLITGELPPEKLDALYPGQRWSIRGILQHIASAEWWYLDRLGLATSREALPADAFECLAATRQQLQTVLPQLAGLRKVVGVEGEFWSPRKLLRRAIWHELDHIEHIIQLL